MNREQLVTKVASKIGSTKVTADIHLDAFIDAIEEEVKNGGYVMITGFAKFDSITRPERSGKSPLNGKPYHTAAKRVPSIKAGATFKAALL